jgi:hypothetical protein
MYAERLGILTFEHRQKRCSFELFRPRGHDKDHGACLFMFPAPHPIHIRWIWIRFWKVVRFLTTFDKCLNPCVKQTPAVGKPLNLQTLHVCLLLVVSVVAIVVVVVVVVVLISCAEVHLWRKMIAMRLIKFAKSDRQVIATSFKRHTLVCVCTRTLGVSCLVPQDIHQRRETNKKGCLDRTTQTIRIARGNDTSRKALAAT